MPTSQPTPPITTPTGPGNAPGPVDTKPGIISTVTKTVAGSILTNAIIGVSVDSLMAGNIPDAGTAVETPQISGEVIKGPAAGGPVMERPMAGALADQSMQQSLSLEYGQNAQVTPTSGEGILEVNGKPFEVAKYIPGADVSSILNGDGLDISDSLSMMAQTGMQKASATTGIHHSADAAQASQAAQATQMTAVQKAALRTGGQQMAKEGIKGSDTENDSTDTLEENGEISPNGRTTPAKSGTVEMKEQQKEIERPQREMLERDHRQQMQESLRTQDIGVVHTEKSIGGKTVSIDTAFEARDANVEKEKRVGDEHVRKALSSGNSEKQVDMEHIRMRSQIEDTGPSLSPF